MSGNSPSRLSGRAGRLVARLSPLLLVLASTTPARAEPTASARALADTLFREGRKLMKLGRHAEACKKLDDSYRIDPAGGTLLNLALCHEEEGKTATAWSEFKESLYLARKARRGDRAQIAEKRLAALEPLLSHVTLTLAKGADASGIEVSLDGVPIGEGTWDTPLPVDPGDHVIVATAPGHERWEQLITVGARADDKTVIVPRLVANAPAKVTAAPAPAAERPAGWMRPAGWIAGGAGVAAIGVGAFFGVRAISLAGDSDARCVDGLCDREGLQLYEDGRSAATASNITVGVGAASLAAGVVLLVMSRERSSDDGGRATLRVLPSIGPRTGGAVVGGSF